MTPRLLTLALVAAFALPVHADQSTKPAASPVASAPAAKVTGRPLLWKVSDADNDVYLLGSFHLLKSDDYPMPAEIDRAFDDAESLLFEIDPREMTAPETVATMQKYMAYEDGQSLSKVLPKATLERLGTLVSASGGSVQALEQSEPWAVSLGLVLGVSQAMGLKADLGLDRHLMDRAAKAGKPAGGLETVDAQMKAMDSVPYAEQAQGLDEFLVDPKKAVQQLQDMHAWWRTGDVEQLDTGMRADMARKSPQSYKLLDVDRNNAWLPQIEKRLTGSTSDDTLVVVGTLHLLGSDGLVEKLQAKGYKVERVCDSCEAAATE
ncbi:TraB/GumN family protein [Thermomonas carbonis]|uniref:TraB/GumN family protein n=1 Tax=Thermomonas carbonis TaxID=1463158 RepID=A0A7G9SQ50_9GAMM|nr:TraB/GumN family protein [Thermomonas carbonis]QNN69975.1 TraB/GumN family protein [Thermomonas carbonis]GHB96763.1 TraB/GumN family protein [Thermomonas carbonis]